MKSKKEMEGLNKVENKLKASFESETYIFSGSQRNSSKERGWNGSKDHWEGESRMQSPRRRCW